MSKEAYMLTQDEIDELLINAEVTVLRDFHYRLLSEFATSVKQNTELDLDSNERAKKLATAIDIFEEIQKEYYVEEKPKQEKSPDLA